MASLNNEYISKKNSIPIIGNKNEIKNRFTEISEYDIVNFYKHRVMRDMADQYEYVCYLDFDVVPNTTDCIFVI